MRKLLVLGAGILQIPVIKKAKELGHYVIAADGDPNAVGLKYADKAVVANITSEETMLTISKKENINGVIHPCSEVSMHVMGRINDELKLCGISKDTATRATNKHLMRRAFEDYGASSPKSVLLDSYEHGWSLFNDVFETDAILKPSRNSGSRGISKIVKGISIEDFRKRYDEALQESRDHSVLIEQFIEGPEFSVEIIAWNHSYNVLAVTDKKTTSSPHFVELGHSQPSLFPQHIVSAIQLEAIKGSKALGINNCAIHAELKLQGDKPYIMEIGARLGGDFISTVLTNISSGVDMVAAAVNVALGIEPTLTPTEQKYGACIRYICPKPGKVISIDGLDKLSIDSVHSYELYCKVGDVVNEVKSSLDRSGHIIVKSSDVSNAITIAEDLLDQIVVKTK